MTGPALVLIDMQAAYCAADGSFASTGRDVTMLAAAASTAGETLVAARLHRVPVLHVGRVNDSVAGPPVTLPSVTCQPVGALKRGSRDADFFGPVRPAQDETVLLKTGFSAFHDTPLLAILARAGIDEIVVVGVTTSVCVEHTVRDAVQAGLRVTVVEDACAEWSSVDHERSIAVMHRWATVCAAADVVDRFVAS